jgi:hypothetical protein
VLRSALARAVPESLRPSERWFQSVLRDFAARGVLSGPFQGMRFIQDHRPTILNCLLGIYERELHPAIEEIRRDIRPRSVIDMGAYFGYYAIGLARMLPECRVTAYEADPAKHPNLRANLAANGVSDRVTLRGLATLETLRADIAAATAPTLVVCDIDGPEIDVMRPDAIPGLDRCWLLIETHSDAITEALRHRLGTTHQVQHIRASVPTMAEVPNRPWYVAFSEPTQFLAERRPDVGWLWARPKLT